MSEGTVDFRALLQTKADDVKPPKQAPEGTYHGVISGVPKYDIAHTKNGDIAIARVPIRLTHSGDDIDPTELDDIDITRKNTSKDFWLDSGGGLYNTIKFIQSVGIESEGRELGELFTDLVGKNVLVKVKHEFDKKDPTRPPFLRVEQIGPDNG